LNRCIPPHTSNFFAPITYLIAGTLTKLYPIAPIPHSTPLFEWRIPCPTLFSQWHLSPHHMLNLWSLVHIFFCTVAAIPTTVLTLANIPCSIQWIPSPSPFLWTCPTPPPPHTGHISLHL
jgi:hypothetical protein